MDLAANTRIHAENIWLAQGLPGQSLTYLRLGDRPDPAVNSSFKLGSVAQQITIGLSGLSAAHLHYLRSGQSQYVSVDPRHAILEFKSESYWLLNGEKPEGALFDELAGVYQTKDGFVRIHTNFHHHKEGILHLLKCEGTRESVQAALLHWNAQEFEDQAAARKMCATKARFFNEWDSHPHSIALKNSPPVELIKVGDAPKRDKGLPSHSPLEGIRVLDLTRILAGPVAGRTLAAHGADVLLVTSPNLPALPFLDKDTSRGKRTTQLDLTSDTDRLTLEDLAKETDVFLQAYRPGGLREKGFGVEDLAKMRPGIVYASLSAYGWEGPWKDRRGFDSLVQNATGFGFAEAEAFRSFRGQSDEVTSPKALPCQAIDHAAGYLLAFGIITALCKTITEGGTWEVRVSLAGVAQWIRSLGQLGSESAFNESLALPPCTVPQAEEIAALAVKLKQALPVTATFEEQKHVEMTAIGHAAKLSLTPVREGEAPLVLDAHEARWLPRG
ncbi:CoA-transferase family III [Phellopilus nigrolimitatus]|nr:CoA-transferase family III [Phellopilus nigrolimitatus]